MLISRSNGFDLIIGSILLVIFLFVGYKLILLFAGVIDYIRDFKKNIHQKSAYTKVILLLTLIITCIIIISNVGTSNFHYNRKRTIDEREIKIQNDIKSHNEPKFMSDIIDSIIKANPPSKEEVLEFK